MFASKVAKPQAKAVVSPTDKRAAPRWPLAPQRFGNGRVIQAKLTVGQLNDPLEHEADQVADQVMRMPDPKPSVTSTSTQLSRKCAACEQETHATQTRQSGSSGPATEQAPSIVRDVLRGPGQPLDEASRAFFEPRLGYDFSRVRVYADEMAAESARSLGAAAYAMGTRIAFGAQRYQPGTTQGRALIAHELAHVIQQRADQTVARQPAPASATVPCELSGEERVWLYDMLAGWNADGESLTESHARNIDTIARRLWERKLAATGARRTWGVPGGAVQLPPEVLAFRDGAVRVAYENYIRIGEQQLSAAEEATIDAAVSRIGAGPATDRGSLSGDERGDIATLAEVILCNRSSIIMGSGFDPLLCISHDVTQTNPIFRAMAETVVRPYYQASRLGPAREIQTAIDAGIMDPGAHRWQFTQISQQGFAHTPSQKLVPSQRLLQVIAALARDEARRPPGRQAGFALISLMRPGQGPHGVAVSDNVFVGRAADIGRYAGHLIDTTRPVDAAEGIAAAIRALPSGCYMLGLPRPPRTDALGGFEDARKYPRFYAATKSPTGPRDTPILSEIGRRAVSENILLPAVNVNNCPPGLLEGSLAALDPRGRAILEPAITEARQRGVSILCFFPDAPDHLHIQLATCPPEPRQMSKNTPR